jgi:hypothetical protein
VLPERIGAMIAPPVTRQALVARSPVPLVVGCFALLTALLLVQIGGAATSLRPNAISAASDPTATATRAAVDQFYAAINVLLATGDTAPLDAAVDPTFVDHVAASSQARDRAALITELLAQRRAGPGLQIDVAAVFVYGDQALAYVQADPFDATAARLTTTIEALRVRDGVVVERWRDRPGTATPPPTPEADRGSVGLADGAVPVGRGTSFVHTPAPAERWSGDGVWRAPVSPTAALATPPLWRFPRPEIGVDCGWLVR